MASYNRVILAGNLTRDPQLSYTPSNLPVTEFGLAVNRRSRDREGNQRDEVCYVDVAAYGKTAEILSQYLKKGRPLLLEGRLRYRTWTNKEGQNRSKLDVVVDSFSFIDSKGSGQGGGEPGGQGGGQASGQRGPASQGGYSGGGRSAEQAPIDPEPPSDDAPPAEDIPF